MDKSGMGHGRRRLLHGLERSSGLRKRKPAPKADSPLNGETSSPECPRRTLLIGPASPFSCHQPGHDLRAGESVAPRPLSSRRTARSTQAPPLLPRISSTYPPPHIGTYEEHCSFFVLLVKRPDIYPLNMYSESCAWGPSATSARVGLARQGTRGCTPIPVGDYLALRSPLGWP